MASDAFSASAMCSSNARVATALAVPGSFDLLAQLGFEHIPDSANEASTSSANQQPFDPTAPTGTITLPIQLPGQRQALFHGALSLLRPLVADVATGIDLSTAKTTPAHICLTHAHVTIQRCQGCTQGNDRIWLVVQGHSSRLRHHQLRQKRRQPFPAPTDTLPCPRPPRQPAKQPHSYQTCTAGPRSKTLRCMTSPCETLPRLRQRLPRNRRSSPRHRRLQPRPQPAVASA